ncbi:MAG: hypothetical protein IPL01_24225 [Acidobacteria bacterium]|nr:hypothetical protein [Acidobacteriota bacterium]
MTKEQAREYIDRWRLVNEHIKQEIRETPPELKLKQMAAIFGAAEYLGWKAPPSHDDEQASERWRILREIYAKTG